MARIRHKVIPKPVLYIACEGTSSEYQYFKSWAETDIALDIFQSINVYPDENEDRPKTTPYELYKKAERELADGSANFAWVVFDNDDHPKLLETFRDSAISGVKIAFSSRSFEEWIIMHFQKNAVTFHATECKNGNGIPINCGSDVLLNCTPYDCLAGHIRRNNFIPAYSKKKTFDLYAAINHLTEVAVVNAAWLRSQVNASLHVVQPPLYTLNPYTDIDQLIFAMHGRSDVIEWAGVGVLVTVGNWSIQVNRQGANIVLQLSHTKPQAVALNEMFTSSSFFSSDDNLHNMSCQVISSQYLVNLNGSTENVLRMGDIVEYTLQSNDQPYFLFKDTSEGIRIYVE